MYIQNQLFRWNIGIIWPYLALLLLITVPFSLTAQTPQAEIDALLALYDSTDGANWNDTTGWTSGSNPANTTWYGVTLDVNDHVIGLDLTNNGLNGKIPAAIGDLTYLSELVLSDNSLSGSIPDTIGSLLSLTDLYLDRNSLNGSIPSSIGNLTSLQYLNLSINSLDNTIPSSITGLTNLIYLFLSENQLDGSIPTNIGNLSSLTHCGINNNSLTGSIPSSLGSITTLVSFNAHYNQLSDSIPPEIGNLSSLQNLTLHYNQLSGNIPPSLGKLNSLVTLRLTSNSLTGSIPDSLTYMSSLRNLYADRNSLSGPLPDSIGRMGNLRILYLVLNSLEGPLPASLADLSQLTQLYLNNNSLSGCYPSEYTALCAVPAKSFANNPGLSDFTDFCNNGTGSCASEEAALMALFSATRGDSAWTDTTGWGVGDPGTWYGITTDINGNVTHIELANNGLLGNIPDEIGNLIHLKELVLSDNDLSGGIPDTIGSLTNLTKLYLDRNQLDGSIPSSIGNLTNLQYLHLGINGLDNEIPSSIGNLANLIYLFLSENSLSGSIPSSIGNLTNVTLLSLNNNLLSDSIPSSIGNMSALTSLTLRDNDLQHSIPSSIGNLTNLQYLRLQNNQLSGSIPSAINGLSSLLELWVGSNNLIGSIPDELCELGQLRRFYADRNSLSGPLPDSIGSLTNLNILYLVLNQLEGPLPPSLADLTNLTQLYVNNNNISGCYPVEYLSLCSLSAKSFANNPGLQDFNTFCADGTTGACTDMTLAEACDCNTPTVTVSSAVPSNENYILTQTYREPSSEGTVLAQDIWEEIAYFDGLGRGLQSISVQASPQGYDMITPMEYDASGRMAKQYLPYVDDDQFYNYGQYRSVWKSPQEGIYNGLYGDTKAYSESQFEESPLNRVIEQGAPGTPWQPEANSPGIQNSGEHTVITSYLTYGSSEIPVGLTVPYYSTDVSGSTTPNSGYSYLDEDLSVIKTVDENGGRSFSFTDKLGRVIMQSTEDSTNRFASTLNIYDAFGNVEHVIQPEGVKLLQTGSPQLSTILTNWAFQYVYDKRQRVISKQVPGADSVLMVYDELDRVVLTQDGNLRTAGDWLFTKYDYLGRPIQTGLYQPITAQTRVQLQTTLDGQTILYEARSTTAITDNDGQSITGYTNSAFPSLTDCEVHSITYYDDYDFNRDGTDDVSYFTETTITGDTAFMRVRGLVTGIKVKILDKETSMPEFLQTVTFYDEYGRELQTQAETHLGGTDISTNQYSFSGELERSTLRHQQGLTGEVTVKKCFSYDHRSRLLQVSQQVNEEGAVIIAKHDYDPLGLLSTKSLHAAQNCSTFLETTDYTYNIRGWMRKINDPVPTSSKLFSMELGYNGHLGTGVDTLFNGNIAAMRWHIAGEDSVRSYGFSYDKLNRLTAANFEGDVDEDYSLSNLRYDLNGNIKTLSRQGIISTGTYGALDDLSYSYTAGNQLSSVADSGLTTYLLNVDHFQDGNTVGNDYEYDPSGNMIKDKNKGIDTVYYNHLNKPIRIVFSTNDQIDWIYSADGTKLKEIINDNGTTNTHDYQSSFFYRDDTLRHFGHEEGRVIASNYSYEYFLKDHLGNTRVTFNESKSIIQSDHYYPFGMRMAGVDTVGTDLPNRYRYNGKELHTELDLGWYDYGARMYDPSIARWNGVDIQAEKYPRIAPYAYAMNNPIIYVDPNGEEIWIVIDGDNKVQYRDGKLLDEDGNDYEAEEGSFAASVLQSLNYLSYSETASERINGLANDKSFNITIEPRKKGSFYEGELGESGGNLKWNAEEGMRVFDESSGSKKEGNQSPSIGLIHEMEHAEKHREIVERFGAGSKEEKAFLRRRSDEDSVINEEEAVVSFETKVVGELNSNHPDLKDNPDLNEGARSSYQKFGKVLRYSNPTPSGYIKKQKRKKQKRKK